jgi:hypothetical protein
MPRLASLRRAAAALLNDQTQPQTGDHPQVIHECACRTSVQVRRMWHSWKSLWQNLEDSETILVGPESPTDTKRSSYATRVIYAVALRDRFDTDRDLPQECNCI